MTTLDLFVPGIPTPQGSKRAFVVKGRAVVVDDNKASLRSWRSAVREDVARWIAEQPTWAPLDEPVRIALTFTLARPVSTPKRVLYPYRKPDLDKLARGCFDAITEAGYWKDDARAVDIRARKTYGDRLGVHILAGPMPRTTPPITPTTTSGATLL